MTAAARTGALRRLTVDLLRCVFRVVALQVLPLFLVQAIVACSVRVMALIVAATGRPLGRPGWAIVIDGILGRCCSRSPCNRGKVTMVAAVTFTTNTVVPSAVGILVLGAQVRSGYAGVATAGFLVAACRAVALARYAGPLQPDEAAPEITPPPPPV